MFLFIFYCQELDLRDVKVFVLVEADETMRLQGQQDQTMRIIK